MANASTAPLDFEKRIKAVSHFKSLEESVTLAGANKRVGNILAKFKGDLFPTFKADLASESEEKALSKAFDEVKATIAPMMLAKDYQAALTELACLKAPIDNFFDNVMVMADDEAIKTNRLTLLNEIRNSFFAIADVALLQ